ncbi:IS630 family transposase [Coraliomargarita sp. SDUM461003]|uniref:IS630 family transposase n=1 Tax=Thalassobacterium maritimum TaxID=3041265 RepID=A0ABU1B1D4_9BACT|nr:IS630 family transposase [Coraliomargarita sp. SDUM461003]MDQ8209499.1 IS630 family transposase [Coraliomargarita sp. SDUM461003]
MKKTLCAWEQNRDDVQEERTLWRKLQQSWDRRKLVFIDECGINTKMTRLYGRSLSSERCIDYAPHGHWHTNTFIAALRHDRIDEPILFDGPMNAVTFLQYIEQILAPTLSPGDIVICDNLSSHKSSEVREVLQEVGADIIYLPPYSPDMNPIEMVFSKIKAYLRAHPSESFERIVQRLAESLDSFSETICSNFLTHAKYSSS